MKRFFKPVRLILLFGAVNLIALVALTLLWLWRDRQVAEGNRWIAHTYSVKVQLEAVLGLLIDVETGQRGFVITGDPAFLEPYQNSLLRLDGALAALGRETSDNPIQRHFLSELNPKVGEKLATSQAIVKTRKDRGLDAARALVASGKGKKSMDALRGILASMRAEEDRLLALRKRTEAAATRSLDFTIALMLGLVGLMAVGFSIVLITGVRLSAQGLEMYRQYANFDPLTGLPNRRLLYELGEAIFPLAQRQGRMAAVLFLDLDGFKAVNDTLGHKAGDQVLREVGQRLKASVRTSDTVARLGGDEFVVFLPEVDGREGAAAVAEKVVSALGLPYILGGVQPKVTTSIGIAFFPQHGGSMETLLQLADSALYRAKATGKNRYAIAEECLDDSPSVSETPIEPIDKIVDQDVR